MHIILGALASIVTILWVLHRLAEMGVGLGGLNPWLWRRRRKWRQQYEANPVYALDKPMDATALVLTAIAKADGDMSSKEKGELLALFETEFHLSERDASGLLASSAYLLGKGDEVHEHLDKVLAPSLPNFNPEQAASAIELIERIGKVDGPPSQIQAELIDQAKTLLLQIGQAKMRWE